MELFHATINNNPASNPRVIGTSIMDQASPSLGWKRDSSWRVVYTGCAYQVQTWDGTAWVETYRDTSINVLGALVEKLAQELLLGHQEIDELTTKRVELELQLSAKKT